MVLVRVETYADSLRSCCNHLIREIIVLARILMHGVLPMGSHLLVRFVQLLLRGSDCCEVPFCA
ncbi:hypothetical protein RP20_CCG008611 [Aedes albopictus]|nr:hypothetical protein RP20_CCG008611 [Aedes albopictus]